MTNPGGEAYVSGDLVLIRRPAGLRPGIGSGPYLAFMDHLVAGQSAVVRPIDELGLICWVNPNRLELVQRAN